MNGEPPERRLAVLVALAAGLAALAAMVSTPLTLLLGESPAAVPGALHAMAGSGYLLLGTVTAYLAYRLYEGRLQAYADLRRLAALSAVVGLATILAGHWLLAHYRTPEGPRDYFLQTQPAIHWTFFTFKQFAGWSSVVLALAAASVLQREGAELRERRDLRQAVAVMLVVSWALLVAAFALGAAITKLRSV